MEKPYSSNGFSQNSHFVYYFESHGSILSLFAGFMLSNTDTTSGVQL